MLSETDLTLDKIVNIVVSIEQAQRDASVFDPVFQIRSENKLRGNYTNTRSNFFNPNKQFSRPSENRVCWRCLGKHKFRDYPAFDAVCRLCKMRGHYSRFQGSKGDRGKSYSNTALYVTKTVQDDIKIISKNLRFDFIPEGKITKTSINSNSMIKSNPVGSYILGLVCDSIYMLFEIDTGASVTVIDKSKHGKYIRYIRMNH